MTDNGNPAAAGTTTQPGAAASSTAPQAAPGGQAQAAPDEMRASIERLEKANREILEERSRLREWKREREAADLDAQKKAGNLEPVVQALQAKLAEIEPLAALGQKYQAEQAKAKEQAGKELTSLLATADEKRKALVAKIDDPILAVEVLKINNDRGPAIPPGVPGPNGKPYDGMSPEERVQTRKGWSLKQRRDAILERDRGR